MPIFPRNNLPNDSLNWGREVEKGINNLESSFRTAEVNNASRDAQLQTSVRRLDSAVTNAQIAIDSVISLSDEGGPTVNASNISGGTITGVDFITTGGTEKTQISQGQIEFFEGETYLGRMVAQTDGENKYILLEDSTGFEADGASLLVGSGYAVMNSGGGAAMQVGPFGDPGRLDLFGTSGINMTGSVYISGSLSSDFGIAGAGLTSTGSVSGVDFSASGQIDATGDINCTANINAITANVTNLNGGFLNVTGSSALQSNTTIGSSSLGDLFLPRAYANTTDNNTNLHIFSSGRVARTTTTSSSLAKENVRPLAFDSDSFLGVSPVRFDYKEGILSDEETSRFNKIGFIAEDFIDAGIAEDVIIPKENENGYIGLRYDKLYMFLHKVVQEQNETIKTLEARLAALEDRVQ